MPRPRRWLAVLCIFTIVTALLAPAVGGASFSGILVPLAPLFGLVVLSALRLEAEPAACPLVASPPLPSRAPPRQLSTD
jgi:hypothetical protein